MTSLNESSDLGASQREQELTDEVVASLTGGEDSRQREVLTALVQHAHAMIREVGLTERELAAAADFLAACGQKTDSSRHEVILLFDVLGLSMQAIAVGQRTNDGDATESTVFGPFFREGSPNIGYGGDMALGASGTPCWVSGTIRDIGGTPVPGARIEAWQADDEGLYDVQHGDGRTMARGHQVSRPDGTYGFWAVAPTPYPVPTDGPVGQLLAMSARSPMRPAHLHLMVQASGHRTLVTHVFPQGDPYAGADPVFGFRESLVVDVVEHDAGEGTPNGRKVSGSWTSVHFDIALGPERDDG